MKNKQKLKTLEEYVQEAICEEGEAGREGKLFPQYAAVYYAKVFSAHHKAILSLQSEVDALSLQLEALQNPKDLEDGAKETFKN